MKNFLLAAVLALFAGAATLAQNPPGGYGPGGGSSSSGGGISTVSSLPATCTPGTSAPVNYTGTNGVAYGIFFCNLPNTYQPDNPSNSVSPLSYNAKWDVQWTYSAAFVNTSPTVTTASGDISCTSTQPGQIAFGTSGGVASNITGAVILAQTTILSCNSAHSFQMNTTASAGCTPSASVTCSLAFGTQPDDAGINAAGAAAWETPGICKAVQFPSGAAFFNLASGPLLSFTPAQLSSPCGGTAASGSTGLDLSQTGAELYGQGPGNTLLIPLPNIVWANCTGGNNGHGCMFGTPNLEVHDLGVNGLNQNSPGAQSVYLVTLNGQSPACTGSTGFNLTLSQWAANSAGSVGILMGAACGDPFYQNLVSESFGATNCYLQGSGTVVTLNAAICFGTLTASLKVIGSGVLDTGGSYFGILGAASAFVVDCTNLSGNAIWNSNGDQFAGGPIGPVPQFLFDCNGGVGRINLTGDLLQMQANTTSTNYGFYVPGSGLSIHVKNSTVSMAGSANLFLDIVAGSTYFDDGGNSYTLGGTASIVGAGSLVADGHSVKGICTGAMTASTTLGLYGTGPNATTTTCTSATIGTGLVVEGTRTLQLMACSVGGSATTTTTCTVVVNGSASAITCNITSGNTTCTDFIHTVALSDGALVSEEIIAGPATTPTGAQMIVVYN